MPATKTTKNKISGDNRITAPHELTDHDIYLIKEGTHSKLYEKFGAHRCLKNGVDGVKFAVWAPNASRMAVIGSFNDWNPDSHPLQQREDHSGIWEGWFAGIAAGATYKYHLQAKTTDYQVAKGDPFARFCEIAPATASVVWELDYTWGDHTWMSGRRRHNSLTAPMSIYEIHLGSWRRVPEDGNRSLSYREMAAQLIPYIKEMGFTHVEFMPVMEHPFFGSWGYQVGGYFAPSSRYGTPQDLMYLIDIFHQNDIGVILDWVPSHFPNDEFGLAYFDGTHLYEHADPRQGFHPDWKSAVFNYGRNEVRAFLISSAIFWLDKYHIDGLRVDGVASMLYLDYSRPAGEWIPNEFGGRENIAAISFLKQFNQSVSQAYPDVLTIAEESTAWPMVSRPVHLGGLGFAMKWNMGWMHDTLDYFSADPIYRKYNHNQLTFSIWYAFSENFMLSLSHDEVVHGKGSLLGKMPGDEWQRFATLRSLWGYMYAHPGKKLVFMGGEFGQWREWNHDSSLDWHLLESPTHLGMQRWVKDLNRIYREEAALFERDFSNDGFSWIDCNDTDNSVISFTRKGTPKGEMVIVIGNFTPVPQHNYRIGVPVGGFWQEILNSDAMIYGGSGQGNMGGLDATPIPAHGHFQSLCLTLPPLAVLYFKLLKQPRLEDTVKTG